MCANDVAEGQQLHLILPEGEGEQEGAPFTVAVHSKRNIQEKQLDLCAPGLPSTVQSAAHCCHPLLCAA